MPVWLDVMAALALVGSTVEAVTIATAATKARPATRLTLLCRRLFGRVGDVIICGSSSS
ncbi:hypothetical protein GCM10027570_34800 [Streptomonospora sediminis]